MCDLDLMDYNSTYPFIFNFFEEINMAIWKVSIKNSLTNISISVSKGMSIDIMTKSNAEPTETQEGRKAILAAFRQKYDIDISSYINCGAILEVEKCVND